LGFRLQGLLIHCTFPTADAVGSIISRLRRSMKSTSHRYPSHHLIAPLHFRKCSFTAKFQQRLANFGILVPAAHNRPASCVHGVFNRLRQPRLRPACAFSCWKPACRVLPGALLFRVAAIEIQNAAGPFCGAYRSALVTLRPCHHRAPLVETCRCCVCTAPPSQRGTSAGQATQYCLPPTAARSKCARASLPPSGSIAMIPGITCCSSLMMAGPLALSSIRIAWARGYAAWQA